MSKRELFELTRAMFLEYNPSPPRCENFTLDELEEYMEEYCGGILAVEELDDARKVISCVREI